MILDLRQIGLAGRVVGFHGVGLPSFTVPTYTHVLAPLLPVSTSLFAAGHAMKHRFEELERNGITESQDSIQRAKKAYLAHLDFLKTKPL